MKQPRRLFGNHGLSIVLAALFALTWTGQYLAQRATMAEPAEFWPAFAAATLANWQSVFLQAFSVVVLATFLIHRGSPVSRDGQDEMSERLSHLEDRIDSIHFQLFEERTNRTPAEAFFDERRRRPDYDQAYRQTWRALRQVIEDNDDEP